MLYWMENTLFSRFRELRHPFAANSTEDKEDFH
jgi:hypothetical protein